MLFQICIAVEIHLQYILMLVSLEYFQSVSFYIPMLNFEPITKSHFKTDVLSPNGIMHTKFSSFSVH